MRLLVIADINDFHWKHGAGKADLLIPCGDVSDQIIHEAALAYTCSTISAVKGNHDSDAPFEEPIVDLHRKIQRYGPYSFGGLNGSWKYKPSGYFLYDQWEVEMFLSSFPPVDIFLSHNSPRGIHDKEDDVHYGFEGLDKYIHKEKSKMLIHGHQHKNIVTIVDDTKVIGIYGHKLIEI